VIEPTTAWKTRFVAFIAGHTPKCHEITRLISESMERPLSWRLRITLRLHYLICVWCERYRDQLVFTRGALRILPDPEEGQEPETPHSVLTERIKSKLRQRL
jgi:hypothetical protein